MSGTLADLDPGRMLHVDTIHLSTALFEVQGINSDEWTRLRWSHDVKPSPLPGVFLNGEWHDDKTGLHLILMRNRVRIEFSLSRLLNGHNTQPVPLSAVRRLEQYLYEVQYLLGISFDIEDLIVTRLDLFTDIELPFGASSAISALWSLTSVDHLQLAFNPTAHDGSYLRWSNSARQLAVYDKSREAFARGISIDENVLRIEYRLVRSESCRRAGLTTFRSLENIGLQDAERARSLRCIVRAMEMKGLNLRSDQDTFADDFAQIMKTRRANVVPQFIAGRLASESLLQQFGDRHGLDRFVRSLRFESHKQKAIQDQIDQLLGFAGEPPVCGPGLWNIIAGTASRIEGLGSIHGESVPESVVGPVESTEPQSAVYETIRNRRHVASRSVRRAE